MTLKLRDGHILIQDNSREFSCYGSGSTYIANCCFPYREKVMICLYENSTGFDNYAASIVLKVVPENTGK